MCELGLGWSVGSDQVGAGPVKSVQRDARDRTDHIDLVRTQNLEN